MTSSTTLDLTYNTDFAQVEVDEQQINLTRFNLLFPEKRPFFLENRGLVRGRPAGRDRSVLQPAHRHRRQRHAAPDSGRRPADRARRAASTSACSTCRPSSVGTSPGEQLHGRAGEQGSAEPLEPRRHVRQPGRAPAALAGDHNYNRTYGVDGKLGIRASGHAQRVCRADRRRPALTGRDHAYSSAFEFRTRTYETTLSYAEVGENFNPEVGFLERPDGYRQVSTALRRHIRTPGLAKLGLREFEPHAQLRELLGIRWSSGNRDAAHRRPLGLRKRQPDHVDGVERSVRRPARTVRGLPGRRRAGRQLPKPVSSCRQGNTDRRKWISAAMSLEHRRLPVGEPGQPGADAQHSARRPVDVIPSLDAQRHRSAARRVRDQPGERRG